MDHRHKPHIQLVSQTMTVPPLLVSASVFPLPFSFSPMSTQTGSITSSLCEYSQALMVSSSFHLALYFITSVLPHLWFWFKTFILPPATSRISFHYSEASAAQQLPLSSTLLARGCWLKTRLCPSLSSDLNIRCDLPQSQPCNKSTGGKVILNLDWSVLREDKSSRRLAAKTVKVSVEHLWVTNLQGPPSDWANCGCICWRSVKQKVFQQDHFSLLPLNLLTAKAKSPLQMLWPEQAI